VAETPKQKPGRAGALIVNPLHRLAREREKDEDAKRYLMTNYGMTPADYRAKWGLSKDYPMVAPNICAAAQELAVKIA